MRILHVTDCYLPSLGGIELHVHDLAQRQRALGHEVLVATHTPAAAEATGPTGRVSAVADEAWVRRRTDVDPRWADVVHAHASIVSPHALSSAWSAARRGVPTVITVHSLWTHVGPLPELARGLTGMRRWPVLWSAVSEAAADPVRTLLGVPVEVVPNAVDLAVWSPAAAPSAEQVQVLSVMRLTSVKRALPLARILAEVAGRTDLRATIVGDGPQRGTLQGLLHRYGLADRVELTGALDRAQVHAHVDRAAVFVAPAHRESFGIAALEARAAGLPVLASARSGVTTFVAHGVDGLLASDDAGFVAGLTALLDDASLRRRITRHNRAVAPAYGWEHALERNAALYSQAADGRAVPALGPPTTVDRSLVRP